MKKRLLPFTFFLFLSLKLFSQVWEPQAFNTLPPEYFVSDISIVNEDVVWAVAIDFSLINPPVPAGHISILLKTTDGGENWDTTHIEEAEGRFTFDIHAFDENTACVTTQNFQSPEGRGVFRTTDGGDDWTEVNPGSEGGVWLHFFDDQEGVCINGSSQSMARTLNGGVDWMSNNIPGLQSDEGTIIGSPGTSLETLANNLWFGTTEGRVFKSTDRGQTWNATPMGFGDEYIYSIAFVDEQNGIALNGTDYQLTKTSDGGATWSLVPYDLDFYEVIAIPCSRIFMGVTWEDDTKVTAISKDLGETWEVLDNTISAWAPSFQSPNLGWMAEGGETGTDAALYKWVGEPLYGRTYVNQNATGNNDGSSWADAYTDLKVAIDSTLAGDEIWVAEGTYLPGNNPSANFLIDKDLKLYGGFAGTECYLYERDSEMYPTILSGDVNGDDLLGEFFTGRTDNVESVVEITDDISNNTIIEGFTIKGGHADGAGFGPPEYGGGIFSLGAPIIRHCIFEQNFAKYLGGGIYLYGQDANGVTIENCRFQDNMQNHPGDIGQGGGLYTQEVATEGVAIYHCEFTGNEGDNHGGGLSSWNSRIYVDSCTFTGNTSLFRGGGIILWTELANSTLSVQNSLFDGNSSAFGGGAYVRSLGSEAEIDFYNNTFINNTSVDPNEPGWGAAGGGMHFLNFGEQTTLHITENDFINNSSDMNGGGFAMFTGDGSDEALVAIDGCSFSNNTANSGGALAAELSGNGITWELKNSTFTGNSTIGSYATAWVWTFTNADAPIGTVMADSCVFENNTSVYTGGLDIGSGTNSGPFDFTISNTSFLNNQADYCGGFSIWGDEGSKPTFYIENCMVEGNMADVRGGGFWILTSSGDFKATMDRCKILNNSSPQGAGITTFLSELNSLDFPENAEINISNSLINRNSGSAAIEVDSFPGFQLTNCTVADNDLGAIQLSDASGLTLQNTILYNNAAAELNELTNDISVTSLGGNLFGDNSLADYVQLSDLSEGNPLFVETADPCNYYSLSADSPAVGHGIVGVNTSSLDVCGNDRIQGGQIDIGAIESDHMGVDVNEVNWQTLEVYPNPVTTLIQIKFPEQVAYPVTISIEDINGKTIKNQMIQSGESVDVLGLVPGMYFLKMEMDEVIYMSKFIKM